MYREAFAVLNTNSFSILKLVSVFYTCKVCILCVFASSYMCTYIHNSYTMSVNGLPDIYTQSPRLRVEDVYIKQATSVHGISNIYNLVCNHVWANQHNHSSMASLYGYIYIYIYIYILDCKFFDQKILRCHIKTHN